MTYYAVLDENNIVIDIFVGIDESEKDNAEQYYIDLGFGDKIKIYSSETYAGEHLNGGIPFRMNSAEIGGSYSDELDAFIPPKPFNQWILDESTCRWVAPIPEPKDGRDHIWDELSGSWV